MEEKEIAAMVQALADSDATLPGSVV